MSTQDEKQTIDLTVSSPNAVEKVQAMLGGYDIDEENVSRVSIEVFEHTAEDPNAQSNGDSDMAVEAEGRKIGNEERKLAPVLADTSYHLVLAAVEDYDGDAVTANELEDSGMIDHVDRQNISSALSVLYRRKLLDRNDNTRPYEYWVSDHGQAQLNEVGRNVDPEDVGGVYAPN